MGKLFTRSAGAGVALALTGAVFVPAVAHAADEAPRLATVSEANDHENGLASISIVPNTNEDGDYQESLGVTLTNTAATVGEDGALDWHCFLYGAADGQIPEDLAQQHDDGTFVGNLFGAVWANNHGTEAISFTLDTSELQNGTYTVASVCEVGALAPGDGSAGTTASGTQDFTLGTPATGSLEGITGSLGGNFGSLGGNFGGSSGDSGSAATAGSLVLGGVLGAAGATWVDHHGYEWAKQHGLIR